MKNWNAPVVEELNVEMTANGFWNSEEEHNSAVWIFSTNDKDKEPEKTES